MASVSKRPSGTWQIQFVDGDRKRRTIYLASGTTKRQAQAAKVHIENLAAARTTGAAPSETTARWVAGLGAEMRHKLASVGLCDDVAKDPAVIPLVQFVDDYIAKRTDVKPTTRAIWKRCRRELAGFFGLRKTLADVTAEDVKDWQRWMLSDRDLAVSTTNNYIKVAKQFFAAAVDDEILNRSPFRRVKSHIPINRSRQFFVTREMAEKVLDTCPDAQWRLMFALSRYGGLRCPSEHLSLTWADILWDVDRIVVTSPKTEHHPGMGSRIIPLFPELRPILEEAFELAEEGSVYVISMPPKSDSNFRNQMTRIVKRAGLTPWPKLFHNLRSTRQTELIDHGFPPSTVCSWLGNSEIIARRHYEQVTDDHFQRAVQASPVLHDVLHTVPESNGSEGTPRRVQHAKTARIS